jgi:ATP phosphoribosyltransferase
MNKTNTVLTIAVQKSGRLQNGSTKLLEEAGFSLANGSSRALKSRATNFPLELLYLRDDDIPSCVAEGVADAGIVGENAVAESEQSVDIVDRLGFARCRLAVAVPRDSRFETVEDLQGKSIATSYPVILRRFLKSRGVEAAIRTISGSAEITPSIGVSDAVCDLVSTGSTLMVNGLREIETVMTSEAVMIGGPSPNPQKKALLDRVQFRMRSVLGARDYKYILLNCPNGQIARITEILPGIKSPTVMPLATEGWSSVHTVVREDEFWEIIDALKENGAEGVLVLPIQKLVF